MSSNVEYAAYLQHISDDAYRRVHRANEAQVYYRTFKGALDASLNALDGAIPEFNVIDVQKLILNELEKIRSVLLATPMRDCLDGLDQGELPLVLLFTGEVNAEVFLNPSDRKPIIAIEGGLFNWLGFSNDLLMRCAEADTDQSERKREFLSLVYPWTRSYLTNGMSSGVGAEKYREICGNAFNILAADMTFLQMLWVLAHEIAHVELGHLRSANVRKLKIKNTDLEADALSCSHEQEFDADRLATEHFCAVHDYLKASDKRDRVLFPHKWAPAVPCVLLQFLMYAETTAWYPEKAEPESHPPAADRLVALYRQLRGSLSQPSLARQLVEFSEAMVLRACQEALRNRGVTVADEAPHDVVLAWKLAPRAS